MTTLADLEAALAKLPFRPMGSAEFMGSEMGRYEADNCTAVVDVVNIADRLLAFVRAWDAAIAGGLDEIILDSGLGSQRMMEFLQEARAALEKEEA